MRRNPEDEYLLLLGFLYCLPKGLGFRVSGASVPVSPYLDSSLEAASLVCTLQQRIMYDNNDKCLSIMNAIAAVPLPRLHPLNILKPPNPKTTNKFTSPRSASVKVGDRLHVLLVCHFQRFRIVDEDTGDLSVLHSKVQPATPNP